MIQSRGVAYPRVITRADLIAMLLAFLELQFHATRARKSLCRTEEAESVPI